MRNALLFLFACRNYKKMLSINLNSFLKFASYFVFASKLYYFCRIIAKTMKKKNTNKKWKVVKKKISRYFNKKRRHNIAVISLNILGLVAVVSLILYFTFSWLDSYTRHNEAYAVPNVCGMSIEQAQEELRKNNIDCKVAEYRYQAGVPGEQVLEQYPKAGWLVKEGRKISVVLSTDTAPLVDIPNVIDNSSLSQAVAQLEGKGFQVELVEYIDGEKDWVYELHYKGKKLKNGQSVPKNSKVVLYVGSGTVYKGLEPVVDEVSGLNIEE